MKVAGRWRYLYRAVDQFGQVIDVLMSEQRDTAAARRFFTRALRHGPAPAEVTTDKAGPYLRVLDELVPTGLHVTEQYANNRVESAAACRQRDETSAPRRASTRRAEAPPPRCACPAQSGARTHAPHASPASAGPASASPVAKPDAPAADVVPSNTSVITGCCDDRLSPPK